MNEETKEALNKMVFINRMVTLQAFVDYYLENTKGKNFSELYPEIEDKYGVLNEKQEEILHEYLKSVYSSFGLDLEKILKEKNEVASTNGKLTKFEMDELIRLADEHYIIIGVISNRKKKLLKKNNK